MFCLKTHDKTRDSRTHFAIVCECLSDVWVEHDQLHLHIVRPVSDSCVQQSPSTSIHMYIFTSLSISFYMFAQNALECAPGSPVALLDVQLHHHVVIDTVDGLLLTGGLQAVAQHTCPQHTPLLKPPATDLQPKGFVASLHRPGSIVD